MPYFAPQPVTLSSFRYRIFKALLILALLMLSSIAHASERAAIGWEKVAQGAILIDVRTLEEYQQGHLDDSLLRPVQEIEAWYSNLPRDKEIVLYCRSGNRSGIAYSKLKEKGFTQIHNAGGYQEMLQVKP
ncbi:rhodanese-like domain-containing protein [Vibrio sp. ZSDE26]|uniref:Rhodanese-like domain-containing protein n=1 Tax=Vibrio amylolyticus TaxID=2847292 RepID=A0A9X1XL92_9VIBR|nr:rhodanese-like domain-containing protein [Vibrio amylolyticus]MCK6262930.1 rhodanese-like domain-containing protein [Vibrio amylolyticus]